MKMNKSDLVIKISRKLAHFKKVDIEEATDQLTNLIFNALSRNDRVEIRGFGTFLLERGLQDWPEILKQEAQ